jgi:hypothetical protein
MQTLNSNLNILEICIYFYKKKLYNMNDFQLEVDGTLLSKPCEVKEAFAKHFETIYNNSHLKHILSLFQTSDLLALTHISNSDICKAVKGL